MEKQSKISILITTLKVQKRAEFDLNSQTVMIHFIDDEIISISLRNSTWDASINELIVLCRYKKDADIKKIKIH